MLRFELDVADLARQGEALGEVPREVAGFFRTATRDVATHAGASLKGQGFCASRRKMTRRAIEVTEKNEHALSNFSSTSPWQDDPLLTVVASKAGALRSSEGASPHQEKKP